MGDERRIELDNGQAMVAAGAQGQGALAGLAQLVKELESTIGHEAAERVRAKAVEGIKAARLPEELEQAFVRRLR